MYGKGSSSAINIKAFHRLTQEKKMILTLLNEFHMYQTQILNLFLELLLLSFTLM